MKNIIVLSTDTLHHRFFINKMRKEGIVFKKIFFETSHVESPFPTGPLFEEKEKRFEEDHFFENVSKDMGNEDIALVANINDKTAKNQIEELSPDFGIVFGTGKIQPNVITLFKDGLINVHRGIAQEYRGLDSDLWAIYHNDYQNIGVTIHLIVPELDTGDIVFQERLKMFSGLKIEHIRYYTTVIATKLVLDTLKQYLDSNLTVYGQGQIGRYYSFMPLDLKKVVSVKFDKYVKRVHG